MPIANHIASHYLLSHCTIALMRTNINHKPSDTLIMYVVRKGKLTTNITYSMI